jgi:hypothetical protein
VEKQECILLKWNIVTNFKIYFSTATSAASIAAKMQKYQQQQRQYQQLWQL